MSFNIKKAAYEIRSVSLGLKIELEAQNERFAIREMLKQAKETKEAGKPKNTQMSLFPGGGEK